MYHIHPFLNEQRSPVTLVSHAVAEQGYAIIDGVFDDIALRRLIEDIEARSDKDFHAAGIGRDDSFHRNELVRRDNICWIDETSESAGMYLEWMEKLRSEINQKLFLGLFDFECHYAQFPQGAFYKKHVDAFRGQSNRRLSTVLYLNPGWQPGDGGELVLYANDGEQVLETVQPVFGRMIFFLSEEFPHEVLVSNRMRNSLTGWFRINGNISGTIDVPR